MVERTSQIKKDVNQKIKTSVKPTGKVLKNSKELRKEKIVAVGVCPTCGKEFIRPYECTYAACDCESVRLIPLEAAMVIDSKSYAKLSNLAKFAGVSVQKVVNVLLDTAIEELEQKGLLNLVKKGAE